MASKGITDNHKATIKRHLAESDPETPIGEIHKELLEVFQHKGKYTLPQISAVTSWLRSQNLQDRRKNDATWTEDFGEASEDIDYNTQAKINSREWHFNNIVKYTSDEQRQRMKLLLMPGRNTYDYEAAQKVGIQTSNLITYMRGDVPAANAEYIRNSRKFGVIHRRIGDLENSLKDEDQIIQGAYLDFFGPFCESYLHALQQLPIEPNAENVCIGVNLMEGRENAKTVESLQGLNAITEGYHELAEVSDENANMMRIIALNKSGKENPVAVKQARQRVLIARLFTSVGIANTKSWLVPEDIKKFILACEPGLELESLSQSQLFEKFAYNMNFAFMLFHNKQNQFYENGVPIDMVLLGSGVRMGAINSPQIKSVEKPERYVSPNGNRPFVSNFAVVETHRDHYAKFIPEMRFFLEVATDNVPRVLKGATPGYFDAVRTHSGKLLRYFSPERRLLAEHNIDDLRAAQYALTEPTVQANPEGLGYSQEEWDALKQKKLASVYKKAKRKAMQQKLQEVETGRIGRNHLCPCGSGKKFKKCCLARN